MAHFQHRLEARARGGRTWSLPTSALKCLLNDVSECTCKHGCAHSKTLVRTDRIPPSACTNYHAVAGGGRHLWRLQRSQPLEKSSPTCPAHVAHGMLS